MRKIGTIIQGALKNPLPRVFVAFDGRKNLRELLRRAAIRQGYYWKFSTDEGHGIHITKIGAKNGV